MEKQNGRAVKILEATEALDRRVFNPTDRVMVVDAAGRNYSVGVDKGLREGDVVAIGPGKQYVYDADRPTRILVDEVDTAIADLTDAEKVTAGEQLLKRVSVETGTPVSDLRQHMNEVAKQAPRQVLTGHGTVGSFRPMPGKNRKQRRAERSKA